MQHFFISDCPCMGTDDKFTIFRKTSFPVSINKQKGHRISNRGERFEKMDICIVDAIGHHFPCGLQ